MCKWKGEGNVDKRAVNARGKGEGQKVLNQNFLSENQDFKGDCDMLYRITENPSEKINNVKSFEVKPISAVFVEFFENSALMIGPLKCTNRKFKSYSEDPVVPRGIVLVVVEYKGKSHSIAWHKFTNYRQRLVVDSKNSGRL